MCDGQTMQIAPIARTSTLIVCLIGCAALFHAEEAQSATSNVHVVSIRSEPSGAAIWKKEGRDYTCTNTQTPGTVELSFHDANDVQKIRVRRFGYSSKNLDIKSADTELTATLTPANSRTFPIADDAAADLKQLTNAVKREFEETLFAEEGAFQCAAFDLDYVRLDRNRATDAIDLTIAVRLDRSFGGATFRKASRAVDTPENRHKMAQAVLDGGIFEILPRVRHITAKFPQVRGINLAAYYPTTEAMLDTHRWITTETTVTHTYEAGRLGPTKTRVSTDQVANQEDVVKDLAVEKTITFVMPVTAIPDAPDRKTVIDAVFAAGKIYTGTTKK